MEDNSYKQAIKTNTTVNQTVNTPKQNFYPEKTLTEKIDKVERLLDEVEANDNLAKENDRNNNIIN